MNPIVLFSFLSVSCPFIFSWSCLSGTVEVIAGYGQCEICNTKRRMRLLLWEKHSKWPNLIFIRCEYWSKHFPISLGIFRNKMKTAKVMQIFKSSKKELLKNCRPIFVLPCFSKILEKNFEYFSKTVWISRRTFYLSCTCWPHY